MMMNNNQIQRVVRKYDTHPKKMESVLVAMMSRTILYGDRRCIRCVFCPQVFHIVQKFTRTCAITEENVRIVCVYFGLVMLETAQRDEGSVPALETVTKFLLGGRWSPRKTHSSVNWVDQPEILQDLVNFILRVCVRFGAQHWMVRAAVVVANAYAWTSPAFWSVLTTRTEVVRITPMDTLFHMRDTAPMVDMYGATVCCA